jgi:osmotically-inducible protein OsmY
MRSDLELLKDVTEELKFEPSVDEKEIGVGVKSGVVTLTGKVPSFAEKFAAERAVERVSGVRAVADDLPVKLTPANSRSDTDVALAAVNALAWDMEVPDDKIKVKVVNGWVTLEGHAEWHFQKAAAERAVRFLTGVKGVTNLIAISPKVSPTDVMKRIEDAIKRSAELDAKRVFVEAEGSKVTLRGTVRSWAERDEAERAAWAVSGVSNVEDRITVSA